MSPEQYDPATLEWREKVCSNCSSCHRLLRFMEGPLCDGCVDADEAKPVRDKYYGIRWGEDQKRSREVADALREHRGDSDPPEASVSGVRTVLRDTLAVDLSCLGKVVFHQPRKSTMDTMREGFVPKAR